jgi:ATP-binding cassette subfamily B protein
LDDGRIVGCGTHAALLQSCEVYQEIYASQFKSPTGAAAKSENSQKGGEQ